MTRTQQSIIAGRRIITPNTESIQQQKKKGNQRNGQYNKLIIITVKRSVKSQASQDADRITSWNRPRHRSMKSYRVKPESNQRKRGALTWTWSAPPPVDGGGQKLDLSPPPEETMRRRRRLRAGSSSRREGREQGSSGMRGAWIEGTPAAQRARNWCRRDGGDCSFWGVVWSEPAREREERTDFYFNIYLFSLAGTRLVCYFIVVETARGC